MGMNFMHAGYEFLSAENNNGDYESCGAIKERNNPKSAHFVVHRLTLNILILIRQDGVFRNLF